jgi:hypothetical protein
MQPNDKRRLAATFAERVRVVLMRAVEQGQEFSFMEEAGCVQTAAEKADDSCVWRDLDGSCTITIQVEPLRTHCEASPE